MGQKYIEIDENNVVLNVYDEINENVPDGAEPISNDEFEMIHAKGFGSFTHQDGVLVENATEMESRLREEIIAVEIQKKLRALIAPRIAAINAMSLAELENEKAILQQ